MKHCAFDWGDVLNTKPEAWAIARALASSGVAVSIISWCGPNDGPLGDEGRARIAKEGISWANIVGFGNAPEVTLAVNADGRAEYQIGQAKARVMREIGATAIFDDNPYICRAVADVKLQAFQVFR